MNDDDKNERGALLDALETKVDVFAAKLVKYYAAVEWGWFVIGDYQRHEPPNAERIRATLLSLIAHVREVGGVSETGGLRVEICDGAARMCFVDSIEAERCGMNVTDVHVY